MSPARWPISPPRSRSPAPCCGRSTASTSPRWGIASCTAGRSTTQPILIDDEVVSQLERFVPLAPLHQPNNLAPIRAIRERFPDLPQVACFDTAFHRGHSAACRLLRHPPAASTTRACAATASTACPTNTSPSRLREVAPSVAKGRVIVAHLGSGASMCALANGRSVESTMGFTALDGLPMGTRPGQIDPGVRALPDDRQGHERRRRSRSSSTGMRAEGPVRHQQRRARPAIERGARRRARDRPFRLSDRAQCRNAGGRARRPGRLRLHGRHRRALVRSFARASPSGWPGSAPSSIRPPTKPRPR